MAALYARVLGVLLAFCCLARTSGDPVAPSPRYTVTDLGTLPGDTFVQANGISADGRVTGTSGKGESGYHAFLYRNGTLRDLGAMPALPRSQGLGVNDKGQVAGNILYVSPRNPDTGSVSVNSHAFFYDSKIHDISIKGTTSYSEATAINDSGEMTGCISAIIRGQYLAGRRAFRYANRKLTLLTMPKDWQDSGGNAINNAGEIVGFCVKSDLEHAFWFHGGKVNDLNTLIPESSGWILRDATGINDKEQIIGYGSYHGKGCSFLYDKGRVVDLGMLPGLPRIECRGINNQAEIVGVAYPDDSGVPATHDLGPAHAFLYRAGKMVDLNSLIDPKNDWFLEEARGINNRGQIVGIGSHLNLVSHYREGGAFLLTPIGKPHKSIP